MILYVLRYYPTLTETFVHREIAALLGRGVRVAVLALGSRADGVLHDALPDVPVFRPPRGARALGVAAGLPSLLARPSTFVRLAREQRPRVALRAAWAAREARALGVTRVHAHFAGEAAEVAEAIAASLGVPYGVTVHAVDLFKPRPSLGRLLRGARPVITIADSHARLLAERYGAPAVVVRTGVDPDVFRPATRARGAGQELICVARYTEKKGIGRLLRAVEAQAGPARLRLVSDAPPSLGSARVTIGPLPPSRVPDALRAADVFVLPCTVAADGDQDGVPTAILEAMATGLPVITTAVGGIAELVDDEVGWLLRPDDDDALRRAILEAADPVERARRGAAARERILTRRLTVERQVDELLAAWEAA